MKEEIILRKHFIYVGKYLQKISRIPQIVVLREFFDDP
jgi:hypothetical protein